MARPRSAFVFPLFAAMLMLPAAALPALEVEVERVTGKAFAAGESGDFASRVHQMTPDGRYLLLWTGASNLLNSQPDTNGKYDLAVYDREAGSLEWVTISYHDPQQLALSQIGTAAISADGRFVAFSSSGHPHAAGSTGQVYQIYLFDRQSRTTVKVSHPPGNPQSHGNENSWLGLVVSQDGRYVAYQTDATNLGSGADDNHGSDVFQYDRTTGTNTLVSHRSSSPVNPGTLRSTLRGMSADGRYLLFTTASSDIVAGFVDNNGGGLEDAYLWDRDSNSSVLVSHGAGSPLAGANAEVIYGLLSADGSRAAIWTAAGNLVAGFADNNGGEADIFLFERASGSLQLVSGVSATATLNRGSLPRALSADGGQVFFFTKATDAIPGLVRPADDGDGLFRFTTATREMALINHKAGQPSAIALGEARSVVPAADGEAVIFVSGGGELVAGQSAGGAQTFAYDMATGIARLVSHVAGQPLAGALGEPVGISADHRYVAFNSAATNLVAAPDDNVYDDAFLYDLGLAAASRLSSAAIAGRKASGGQFDGLASIPAAGLFLFHAIDVTPFLPGIVDQGGFDPVLVDPRTGTLTALVAPGGATPDGQSRATFLPDGVNFLLRSSGSNLVPGMTDGNGAGADLYAGNRTRGGLQLISTRAGSATASANATLGANLAFSQNGRFVAYDTFASDAVAGVADTNGVEDVILHDRQLGTRVLVSRAAAPAAAAGNGRSYPVAMSADGELLLFASRAADLVPLFVDRNGPTGEDYFLYRRSTGAVTLVTHAAADAAQGGNFGSSSGRLSADGRFVFFVTTSRNLVAGGTDHNSDSTDVFAYETATGAISRLSHIPGDPLWGVNGDVKLVQSSADGRFLLLDSTATDLIAGGTFSSITYNAFLYDRVLDQATLISHRTGSPLSSLGATAQAVTMTEDARFVVFSTAALDVVPGQTLESLDHAANLFLVDRETGDRAVLSRGLSSPTATGSFYSGAAVLAPDARHALFLSTATNLSLNMALQASEVYLAGIPDAGPLFRDGFESGGTAAWSQTVGGN